MPVGCRRLQTWRDGRRCPGRPLLFSEREVEARSGAKIVLIVVVQRAEVLETRQVVVHCDRPEADVFAEPEIHAAAHCHGKCSLATLEPGRYRLVWVDDDAR